MARLLKQKSDDQPEPENSDLTLNLAFASTSDLIAELMKRCDAAIVAYQLTDKMMESEPGEADVDRTEGGKWNATCFTGSVPVCVGLAEICKHDLLKSWD